MNRQYSQRRDCISRLFPEEQFQDFAQGALPIAARSFHGSIERLGTLGEVPELKGVEPILRSHTGPTKAVFHTVGGEYQELTVSPLQAAALYAAGMTVAMNRVEHSIPAVRRWLEALCRQLGCSPNRAQVNAYASHAGPALPMHFDGHEVLVVQLRGRKLWYLANRTVQHPVDNFVADAHVSPSLASYAHASDLARPMEEEIVDMRSGSVLFLPRGTWHGTRAVEESLSLSFSFLFQSRAELAAALVRQRAMQSPSWRQPIAVSPTAGKNEGLRSLFVELSQLASEVGPADLLEIAQLETASTHAVPEEVLALRAKCSRAARIRVTGTIAVAASPDAQGMIEVVLQRGGDTVSKHSVHPRVGEFYRFLSECGECSTDNMLGASIALADRQVLAILELLQERELVAFEDHAGNSFKLEL